jgi:hypothetical protein
MLQAIALVGEHLELEDQWLADERLLRDRQFVCSMVKLSGYALRFADVRFRDDPTIVLLALETYAYAFAFAGDGVKGDRETVLQAVEKTKGLTPNGGVLVHASPDLRHDRDLVKEAINLDPFVVRDVPQELSADRELVKLAVAAHGGALAYASDALRRDPAVVLEAVATTPGAFSHAHPSLRDDVFSIACIARNRAVVDVIVEIMKYGGCAVLSRTLMPLADPRWRMLGQTYGIFYRVDVKTWLLASATVVRMLPRMLPSEVQFASRRIREFATYVF